MAMLPVHSRVHLRVHFVNVTGPLKGPPKGPLKGPPKGPLRVHRYGSTATGPLLRVHCYGSTSTGPPLRVHIQKGPPLWVHCYGSLEAPPYSSRIAFRFVLLQEGPRQDMVQNTGPVKGPSYGSCPSAGLPRMSIRWGRPDFEPPRGHELLCAQAQ